MLKPKSPERSPSPPPIQEIKEGIKVQKKKKKKKKSQKKLKLKDELKKFKEEEHKSRNITFLMA